MKKRDLIWLYINFRLSLLSLIGYKRIDKDVWEYMDADYNDHLEVIYFDVDTGKKTVELVRSMKAIGMEQVTKNNLFMIAGFQITRLIKMRNGCLRCY